MAFVVPSRIEDPSSCANNYDARVTHFHLSLTANFETNVLSGHCSLDVEVLVEGTAEVKLDYKMLTVTSVIDLTGGASLTYVMGVETPELGGCLSITLPSTDKGATARIQIAYETSPAASAVQWLPASQTSGKTHPYLFTQCQAIHARTMFPCQDTPSNKCPYTAEVVVPNPLVALMSAKSTGCEPVGSAIKYTFDQHVPMPSYLVALAIGALEKRDIGPRSAVWSEKEMVDAGAFEFAETEKFIQVAEDICGPYVWGRYDILLLPPSFPYGGMENPCLTFVTPTLLAGDRSLADVVAHEIAHSWMGNLVTSQTWEHFWMNEGFTVFLERKITQQMHSKEYAHLSAAIGWKALVDSVNLFGHDHPYTVLNVKLQGVDPDDAFSSVPYEKGFNFLFYLQSLVGGDEPMNQFLRAHCDKYKFSCVNSQDWKEFFLDFFKDIKELEAVDWDTWLHKPGLPPQPKLDTTLMDAAQQHARKLMETKGLQECVLDMQPWETFQKLIFLQEIQACQDKYYDEHKDDDGRFAAFAEILTNIDASYGFVKSHNAEIRFRWFTIGVRSELEYVLEPTLEFLREQGRMKYIRPLYRDLHKSKFGNKRATETFRKHRSMYHNIAQKMIAKDLGVELS